MTSRFLDRARREALRYGSDPWVLVRELLQNARDARARAVELRAEEGARGALFACRDDGSGMTFEHARRFLFALYASSKESDRGAAGRFGVGFWSVLRFEPSRIVVRSWPGRGEPWEVELDGALSRVERRPPPPRRGHGTEVILERPARDGQLGRRVRDAAYQSGRFLRRRDDRTRALVVRVNGEPVSVPFSLPAPSTSFRRGRLRGAVGLGREARVELFARGLRVRSASAVEDLLAPDGSSALTRVRFPTLADGVAPQAILDGEDLDPLLAREDVRANAALRRLVRLAQAELRRLVESQLEAIRPGGRARRAVGIGLAILATAAAFGGASWLRTAPVGARPAGGWGRPVSGGEALVVAPTPRPPRPFRDLASFYKGPRSDVLGGDEAAVPLRYSPPQEPLRFAALVLDRPLEGPRPLEEDGHADGPPCREDGVLVALLVEDGPGPLRLPRPTGHRVCAGSARLDGRPLALRRSTAGERYVVLDRRVRGVLRYRTAPGADPAPAPARPAVSLPGPLAAEALRLRAGSPGERASAATEWVRAHVAYSTSAETAERHAAAARAGQALLARALAIGAGDCDVQNAVLTTLLQAAGVRARLAVGFLGRDGRALAPLHAWAEVEDAEGRWRVADASGAPPGAKDEVSNARRVAAADGEGRAFPSTPWREVPSWLGPALGALGILGGAGLLLTRPRRKVRLAPDHELAPLLLGALERPEAFRHVPALFARRLVPTLSPRPASLDEAGSLARARRLFRSASGSGLARRASASGAVVLDAARAEGRVVADALGAIDLDEWDAFLARCRRPPVLAAVDARLRRLGETWEVRAVGGLVAPAVLDLPSGHHVRRIVVVDLDAPWLAAAGRLFRERRHEAVFAAVERLVDVASVPAPARRFLLRTLAREALQETAP
jgi:transglutaminase-like putative cysteine protease